MSIDDEAEDITLEVGLAYQDPINNLRIVRLPARTMFQLDVLIEDVVQIEGGPLLAKMDVLVWAAYPEDEERLIARASKAIMDGLELKEGDLVKVRLSAFQKESKQRRESSLHHNKEIKVLTKDDLVAAEVTEVDNMISKSPEKACTGGELLCVPDKDGAIILVGEDVDFGKDTSTGTASQNNALPQPEVVSAGDQAKGESSTGVPPPGDDGEYEEQIEIVNHRVEISEMTRMRITRKKKPGPETVDAEDLRQEPAPPEKPK